MRAFDYTEKPKGLLTPEIVGMVAAVHEHRGRQAAMTEGNREELATLLEIARVQSTGASNRIEGIATTDKRLEELVRDRAEPRNRSEQEIAGYREVLSLIHENYAYMIPRPNVILQMHRELYSYSGGDAGGVYKNGDNVILETAADGRRRARFVPVPAFQTPDAMEGLCRSFLDAWDAGEIDRLVLIPMFILDFLCIHPFNDGNGRMSRLLTLLLLYRAGYEAGRYISLEMLIERTKETYYEALGESSRGWHEGENDYGPFLKYLLGIVLKACRELEARVGHLESRGQSKAARVRAAIGRQTGKITKREILERCPGVSRMTVERVLSGMVKEGALVKVGAGPSAGYVHADAPGRGLPES